MLVTKLTAILSSWLTLHICGDGGQGGWVEGDCIVCKRRGQIRWVQGLDVWHAHSGLVGQHSERKQQTLMTSFMSKHNKKSSHYRFHPSRIKQKFNTEKNSGVQCCQICHWMETVIKNTDNYCGYCRPRSLIHGNEIKNLMVYFLVCFLKCHMCRKERCMYLCVNVAVV